jgi:RNA polymerase-binding transcription factor DksA
MSANHTIRLIEIPIGGKGGLTWNRLHSEREDTCEALLKDDERKESLQARLRKVDDALDRLMSGSYGICSKCGRSIDEWRLDIDPALELCIDCGGRESAAQLNSSGDVVVEKLNAFDTITIKTQNSLYRLLLLDPKSGRALIEGGDYLLEPSEALLKGSIDSQFKVGTISVGSRLELWVDERVFLTSPVKSVLVKHNSELESLCPQNSFSFPPGFSPVGRDSHVEKPF